MMPKYVVYVFLFCLFPCFCLFCGEREAIKRVRSHLVIQDYHSALNECKEAFTLYPDSEEIKKVYVQALAQSGKDDEALSFWKKFGSSNICDNFDLLEILAWEILTHFETSSQLEVSTTSLMRTSFTENVRAVELLLKHLHSTNATMRAKAAQLAHNYCDVVVVETLQRLLTEEKVWFVRLQIIKALGVIGLAKSKERLTKIICHPCSTVEEKRAVIDALVSMYEEVNDREIVALITSKRAELRQLACQVIAKLDLKQHIDAIVMFLDDPCPNVRVAALNTLHFLGLQSLTDNHLNKIVELTSDPYYAVALTSAWIVSRFAPEAALLPLKKYIHSFDDHSRYLAAFVLGRVGHIDDVFLKEIMETDPYVRANIALGMADVGRDLTSVADMLYRFLMEEKDRIMWDSSDNPLFEIVLPSLVCHRLPPPYDYAMLDQSTRLEMFCTLVRLNHPHAQEAIKTFLTHPILGFAYGASIILLEEGGEDAIDIVRNVMQEQDQNIQIQAALVLALAGDRDEAKIILQKAYTTTGRIMKLHILDALGYIGDKSVIPFLAALLEEPHQILKVMAASALIQCLYH